MSNEVLSQIKKIGIVPVVVIRKIEDTISTLSALYNGGIPIAEITFRTECAEEAIQLATKKLKGMLIGAGTVINANQCQRAIKAGAKFIVSPGLSEEVARLCVKENVLYIPGALTPTEIMQAIELGITVLKFFPAELYGGLKAIKALSAAFPQVNFVPTGGVNENNIIEYLSFAKVVACGGSWMVKDTEEEIEKACRQVITAIGGMKN